MNWGFNDSTSKGISACKAKMEFPTSLEQQMASMAIKSDPQDDVEETPNQIHQGGDELSLLISMNRGKGRKSFGRPSRWWLGVCYSQHTCKQEKKDLQT